MNHDVLKQAAQYSKEHRKKNRRFKALGAMAAVVVFCTTYALILPAATLERKPVCGLDEHVHDESCYGEVLACALEEFEGEGHVHTDECYTVELVAEEELVCTEAESEGHTHGADCYEIVKTEELTCTEAESEGHTHSSACYETVEHEKEVLTCSDSSEEHEHDESCYTVEIETEEVLVCGEAESEGHTHGADCYEIVETEELICTEEETEGHTHSAYCYETVENEVQILNCDLDEAVPHTHSEDCYETVLICGLEEHVHDDLCYIEEIRDEDVALDAMPGMALLPSGAQVPEGYTVQYDCADPDGAFVVTVYAPEGALPEEAQLFASLLAENSAEYNTAAEALDEDSYDGMVALDIHFEVEGYGEVEPFEPVYVVINALGLLPADADPESVAIQHLEENAGIMTLALVEEETGSDVNVVVVADSSAETGIVEVTESIFEADVSAAFEVESFSYFTITYKNSTASLKVYLVDENGNDIGAHDIQLNMNYDLNNTKTTIESILKDKGVNLATYSYNGAVYQYVGAYTNATNGEQVYALQYTNNSLKYYTSSSSNRGMTLTNGELYLRYTEAQERLAFYYVLNPANEKSTLSVTDNVGTDGNQWLYFGSGLIYRNENTGTKAQYTYDSAQVVPDTLVYPDKIQVKNTNGEIVTYYYEGLLDGKTPEEVDQLQKDANGLFYNVTWVRFVDTQSQTHPGESATTADNKTNNAYLNEDDLYKGPFTSDYEPYKNTWHVDGYLVLRPKVQVKYYVLDENLQGAQLSMLGKDGFYAGSILTKGATAEQMKFTSSDTGLYGDLTFSDWYTDKECTNPWNFADPVNSDLVLYHKLEIKRPTSYNLSIGKVAATAEIEDNDTPLADLPGLSNATFTIYDDSDMEMVTLTPNKLSGQTGPATAATNDKSVLLEFNKVYKLVEAEAPAGYNKLTDPIYFKAVCEDVNNITLFLCDEKGEISDSYPNAEAVSETLTLLVANYGGFVLPSTGGPGTDWMYALGGALLITAAAAAVLVYKKRDGKEDCA